MPLQLPCADLQNLLSSCSLCACALYSTRVHPPAVDTTSAPLPYALCLLQAMLAEYKTVCDAEKAEVVELGGLHVVGVLRRGRLGAKPCSAATQGGFWRAQGSKSGCPLPSPSKAHPAVTGMHKSVGMHGCVLCPHPHPHPQGARTMRAPQVGTERHESRRVDNQLRGRSGRQGDPGSTRCAPAAACVPQAAPALMRQCFPVTPCCGCVCLRLCCMPCCCYVPVGAWGTVPAVRSLTSRSLDDAF